MFLGLNMFSWVVDSRRCWKKNRIIARLVCRDEAYTSTTCVHDPRLWKVSCCIQQLQMDIWVGSQSHWCLLQADYGTCTQSHMFIDNFCLFSLLCFVNCSLHSTAYRSVYQIIVTIFSILWIQCICKCNLCN